MVLKKLNLTQQKETSTNNKASYKKEKTDSWFDWSVRHPAWKRIRPIFMTHRTV